MSKGLEKTWNAMFDYVMPPAVPYVLDSPINPYVIPLRKKIVMDGGNGTDYEGSLVHQADKNILI